MPFLVALCLFAAAQPVIAAPVQSRPEPPSATLILFRDIAEPLFFKPEVTIDGQSVGRLGHHRWIALRLSPGPKLVETRWPRISMQAPAATTIVLAPGEQRFLELRGTSAFGRQRTSVSDWIEHEPEAGAAAARACCKPVPSPKP